MSRLETVAPDLVVQLSEANVARRNRASRAVVEWILERTELSGVVVELGRKALEAGDLGDSPLRAKVWELVESLDSIAFYIQDAHPDSDDALYIKAFGRARASNSLWYALAGSSAESAMECAYEAQAAFGELTGLKAVIADAMAGED